MPVSCMSTCPCPGEPERGTGLLGMQRRGLAMCLLLDVSPARLRAPTAYGLSAAPPALNLPLTTDPIYELERGGGGLLLVPTDEALLAALDALNMTGACWVVWTWHFTLPPSRPWRGVPGQHGCRALCKG